MAHPRLEQIRARYDYRCGYCGVTEVDVGGLLTVDHYHPTSAGGGDGDDNLVYACFLCNIHKGDFVPTAEQLRRGHRLLHPLLDQTAVHYREDAGTGLLVSLTEAGRFHIAYLQLNREALVVHRQLKKVLPWLKEAYREQAADLKELRKIVSIQSAYIADLLRELDEGLQ